MTLNFLVNGQHLFRLDNREIADKGVAYLTAHFEFSDDWEGYTKTALFRGHAALIDGEGNCTVPWEALDIAGECPVSVFGVNGDKRITSCERTLYLLRSGYRPGQTPKDPSPDVYAQLTSALGTLTNHYRGDYDAGTTYNKDDLVFSGGATYWHKGSSPTKGVSTTDTNVWMAVSTPSQLQEEVSRVAGEVETAKAGISQLSGEIDDFKKIEIPLVVGSYNGRAGSKMVLNTSQTKRVRAKELVKLNAGESLEFLEVPSNIWTSFNTVNSEGIIIAESGWNKSNVYIASDEIYVMPMFRNDTNTNVSVSDVGIIVLKQALRTKVENGSNNELESEVEELKVTVSNLGKSSFQSYYANEITSTIDEVRNVNTEPSLKFILVTDIHGDSDTGYNKAFDYSIENMKEVCKTLSLDGIINLGDIVDGYAKATPERVNNAIVKFKGTGLPYYHSIGNHDDGIYTNSEANPYPNTQIFSLYNQITHNVEYDESENGLNFYKDFDEIKIRMIVLKGNKVSNKYGFSESTCNWFSQKALNTSNQVIIFCHIPTRAEYMYNNESITNGSVIEGHLNNFKSNGGIVIGYFYGHTHCDIEFLTENNIKYICNASQKFENSGTMNMDKEPTGAVYPTKEKGTYTEDCWNVLVIKPISKTVDIIRFGAGDNKHYTY